MEEQALDILEEKPHDKWEGRIRAHWTSGLRTYRLGYELGYKLYQPYNVIFYHRAVDVRCFLGLASGYIGAMAR